MTPYSKPPQAPQPRRGGITFFGALQLMFIGFKITNMIDWSWWWVLSPLWGVVVVAFLWGVLLEIRKQNRE